MKIFIIFSFIILCSCNSNRNSQDINSLLLSIKNYNCTFDITFYSNKNSFTASALQTYNSPQNYSMEFIDNDDFSTYYSEKTLTLINNSLNSSEKYDNYEDINTNPLFLSYFLNSYFNIPTENIKEISSESISINLPNNNPYLVSATLTFKNNTPYSLIYYDTNNNSKINIIYNKFTFESS